MIVIVANQIETAKKLDYCAVSRRTLIIDAMSLHLNLGMREAILRIH